MRTADALRDRYGLALVLATGVALFALQAGPIVALVCAFAVLGVRLASGAVASWWLDRARRRLLYGNWYDPLTPRQAEVAVLVADGLSDKEIGTRLFITERGAEGLVRNIRLKLDVHNRAQIAAWVRERQAQARASTTQPVPKRG